MGGTVLSLLLGLRPNYGRGNGGNPSTGVFSAPDPMVGTVNPHLHQRFLDTHRQVWVNLLWESLLHSLGSLYAQGFVCALQKSVSPVLWMPCNQIPLASKVKFPKGSVPLPDSQVGNSVVGPRTFVIVRELLCYNHSPVFGSSAQGLPSGVNDDLLQEDLCHILCLPGLLHPEPLSLWQTTVDPYLHMRHSNTERQFWLSLLWGPCSQLNYFLFYYFGPGDQNSLL